MTHDTLHQLKDLHRESRATSYLKEEVETEAHVPLFFDPFVYESLLSRSGKPRLARARSMLLNEENLSSLGFSSLEQALKLGEGLFDYWRSFAEFMVLCKEYVGRGDPKPKEYIAVKCSKRGNDVYQRRIKTRFSWLSREIPDKKFFEIRDFQVNKEVKTSLLWITLTWDTKRGDLISAWLDLGKDFNRFLSALRRKYGKISSLRVWEAYESGYPHVHVVMLFEEAQFLVFPWVSESNAQKESVSSEETSLVRSGRTGSTKSQPLPEKLPKLTFRISEKEEISEFWHSHVDIQAISSLSNVFTYIKKHQEKIILGLSGSYREGEDQKIGFDLEDIRGLRTLFLCWIFRKRSFSVSGDFREKLSDLINHLHNSNMERRQLDLNGEPIIEWVWTFMGIFSGEELGIPSFIWAKRLEASEIEGLIEKRAYSLYC